MSQASWWQKMGPQKYYRFCRRNLGYSPKQAQVSVAMAFSEDTTGLRQRLSAIRNRRPA